MPQIKRETRIKKELAKLEKLFAGLPENERRFVAPLLQNAAFMAVTLEDLQVEINENGVTDQYKNGENQFGRKISADIQAYNTTMKTYNTLMDKLMAKLPQELRENKLGKFLNE